MGIWFNLACLGFTLVALAVNLAVLRSARRGAKEAERLAAEAEERLRRQRAWIAVYRREKELSR